DRINEILYVVIPDDEGRPVGLLMMHNWEIEIENVTKLSVKQENLSKIALVLGHIGSRSQALDQWQKEQADFLPYLRLKGNLHDLRNGAVGMGGWIRSTAAFTQIRNQSLFENFEKAQLDLEQWIAGAMAGPRRQTFEEPGKEYLRASKAIQKMRAVLRQIEDPVLLEKIHNVTAELLATPSEEVLGEVRKEAKAIFDLHPETRAFFEDLISFSEFNYQEYSALMSLRKAMHEDRELLSNYARERLAFESKVETLLQAAEIFEKSLPTLLPEATLKSDRVQKGLSIIREEMQRFKRAKEQTLREWPGSGQGTAGKPLDVRPVKIGSMLLNLKRAYEGQFEQSQLHLKLEGIDEWAQTEVKTDPEVLERFLRELLVNAFKYSVRKASQSRSPIPVIIKMDYAQKQNHLRVSVEDFGQGIPKDDQRFIGRLGFMSRPLETIEYRVNGEQGTASRSGTGLAVEGTRIKEMGGSWGFSSEEGVGSVFWVDMPIVSGRKGLEIGKVGARLSDATPAMPSPNTPRFNAESSTSAIFDMSPVVSIVLKKISNGEISPIGVGVQFVVYESDLLPGQVLKTQARHKQASRRFNITSLKTTPREQEGLYEELYKSGLTVETKPVRVPWKDAQGREGTLTVYLQKKVKLLKALLSDSDPDERISTLKVILQGLTKFHKRLWEKGFFDGDFRSLDGIGVVGEKNLLRIIDYGFVYRLPSDPEERRRFLMNSGKVDEMSVGEFFVFNVLTRFKESIKRDLFDAYARQAFPDTNPENLGDAARQDFDESLQHSGFESAWNEFVQEFFPGIEEEEIRAVLKAFKEAFGEARGVQTRHKERRDEIKSDLEKTAKSLEETTQSPEKFSPGYVDFKKRQHEQAQAWLETLDIEIAFEAKMAFCDALRTEKNRAAFERVLERLPWGARLAEKEVNVPEGLRFFAGDAEGILSERLKDHVDTREFAPRIESFINNLRAAADAVEWNNAPLAAESMDRAMDSFYYMENWLGEAASTL
ncbi:MAG TPA: HAMP domain-containing sensor histidine kinase, partial [Candidatus Omnitrophota bacterium]|nr:HAMP domain-containing sensor histidine kinase [Candidatus Omnitrophota bacterium]